MSLLRIAWRNFRHRTLSSLLTTLSLALGVGLVVIVLAIYGVVREAFVRNATVGYNLVVGPEGGSLQLVLNSVFYLSKPIENLPYEYYMEFMPQTTRKQLTTDLGGDPKLGQRDGKYSGFVAGGYAIPLALGDYYDRFRLVGTTPDFFDKLLHGPNVDQPFTFAAGENFVDFRDGLPVFESVLGSRVADEMGVSVGDVIYPTHGDPDGKGHGEGFEIVGVLDPTGTPNDRAAFVNLEAFFLMENHAKPVEPDQVFIGAMNETLTESVKSSFDGEFDDGFQADVAKAIDSGLGESIQLAKTAQQIVADAEATAAEQTELAPLPIPQREVTAILVQTGQMLYGPTMENMVNEEIGVQAVPPIGEISNLMAAIIGPMLSVFIAITLLTCIVAAVGVLVAIYNSMNDRRRDIAVMRALGARRDTVTAIILLESFLIALIGGIVGWLLAHLVLVYASGYIEAQTGAQIGFWTISQYEIAVLPLVIGLALLAGLLPAMSAYRTDVGSNLSA